jgi:hypothetical protein
MGLEHGVYPGNLTMLRKVISGGRVRAGLPAGDYSNCGGQGPTEVTIKSYQNHTP